MTDELTFSPDALDASPEGTAHGRMLANISTRVVRLQKESYGKGPTKAKTYHYGDVVLVLLRGGRTRIEETLLQEGHDDIVVKQRMAWQDSVADRLKLIVEEETGRTVEAFMSATHQDPDVNCEIFVLEPAGEELDET